MKNKGIVPSNSRYVPLTQQPFCCVPTCFQIIMLRHNIPLLPAELMAHHMAVVVPKDKAELFWNIRTASKKPKAGYGTSLSENLTADVMFKKLKIPLRVKWNLINNFGSANEIQKYMYDAVKADKDIILCYKNGPPFNNGSSGGHACVLDRVYPAKKEVRFIDPGRNVPKWRTVKISKLFKAMKDHGPEYMGGFWEVEKQT